MSPKSYARVLTIAGSDSGGGAGIQADLKTFEALGCFGMSAVTALTAQNTVEIKSIYPVTPSFVQEQMEAVLTDIGVDVVKIGMLGSSAVIQVVAETLQRFSIRSIVLDPVMIAKSGDHLLRGDAVESLKMILLPLAQVVTPNLPEAEVLVGFPVQTRDDMERAAQVLLKSCPYVVVKGGHLASSDECNDLIVGSDGQRRWLSYPRIQTKNTHGTGCTYAAAIAACAAKGLDWVEAVVQARDFLQSAIVSGAEYSLGHGHGSVHHAYKKGLG